MAWHSLSLGDALLAEDALAHVRERYAADALAGQAGAAVFARHESEGRLHCELVLYLSPVLAALAGELGARPCARPARSDLGLVAGPESAWALLQDTPAVAGAEPALPQAIIGFHLDAEGHWVADLACGHGQHVRHNPPWTNRPWVLTAEGRAEHLGRLLLCRKCGAETP